MITRAKRPGNSSQNLGQPAVFSSAKLKAVGILVPLEAVISKSEEVYKISRWGDRAHLSSLGRQQRDLGDGQRTGYKCQVNEAQSGTCAV